MASTKEPLLTNRLYNALKWLAQIGLPATGTAYFTFAQIWGLPHAEEVVGSITAFDAFLGLLLGVSSASFKNNYALPTDVPVQYDGTINVTETGDKRTYTLALDGDPDDLKPGQPVLFKVAEAKEGS